MSSDEPRISDEELALAEELGAPDFLLTPDKAVDGDFTVRDERIWTPEIGERVVKRLWEPSEDKPE